MRRFLIFLYGILLLAVQPAWAHSFGKTYALPVPLWLYSYGAASALILSFFVAAWLTRAPPASLPDRTLPVSDEPLPAGAGWRLWQGLSLASLLLSLATGWFGSRNPYSNFSMTWFWVVFLLGTTYLTALIGGGNARANPWHVMVQAVAGLSRRWRDGIWTYPAWLGYWPALLAFMALIWVELFVHVMPFSLACLLLGYSLYTLLATAAFGASAWLRHGELFSVFLRLMALMACRRDGRWQSPFSALLTARCESFSLLVFLLFMLSATSFDGLHESAPWVRLFWTDIMLLLRPWLAPPLISHYALLLDLYLLWQTVWLLLSPFIYLLFYLAGIWLMRVLTGSRLSVRELALHFGFSLLPIVLAYHVSHYLALLITQGTQLLPLLSDPFGRGWNLFGTADWLRVPLVPSAGVVWHAQVAVIVAGHVVSVWLAHVEALRLFGSTRLALRSQWPMLLLMVLFTTSGLWILAQPFSPGIGLRGLSGG